MPKMNPLARHHMAQLQGCQTRKGQRRFSSGWVCSVELHAPRHWGRKVLEGSWDGAVPLPDVALDAAVAPDLVLYQVSVVGGGDEVMAEGLAHVLPQCPVLGIEDGALRGAEVHEEPVGTQHMASPGCRQRGMLEQQPGAQRAQDKDKQGCWWLLIYPTWWAQLLPEARAQGEMPQGSSRGEMGNGLQSTSWQVNFLHPNSPGMDEKKGNFT